MRAELMRTMNTKQVLTGLWLVAALCTVEASTARRALAQTPPAATPAQARPALSDGSASISQPDEPFNPIYRQFYERYQLGPEDELAIHITGHPDYSVEKARVSPVGRIHHPLLGEIEVAGLTLAQATKKLSDDLCEYIINPKVSLELLTTKSARIGVLGDILRPGIVEMRGPMTVLDAITAAGGFAETGSKSNVTLLRRSGSGWRETRINVKRMLEARAAAEENLQLEAGDTLIVHGNVKKTLAMITSLAGFSGFLSFVSLGAGK